MPRPSRRLGSQANAVNDGDVYSAPLRESVKVQKTLIRLKIFTPITVLINILVGLIATLVAKPGLSQLSNDYYTLLTPSNLLVAVFWLVIFVLQLGYCLILLTAYKDGTLATLTSPLIGPLIPIINVLFSFWALFFLLKFFIVSEVLLLINLVLLLTIYIGLFRHPAQLSRPFDYLFIHVPYKLLLVFLLNLDVLHNGLLALGWYRDPQGRTHEPRSPGEGGEPGEITIMMIGRVVETLSEGWEKGYEGHSWIVFTVLLVLGLLSNAIIFITTDPVWAIGTIYANLAIILKTGESKPPQILIPSVLLSVLALLSLLASFLWDRLTGHASEGRIRLADDAHDAEAGLQSHAANSRRERASVGLEGGDDVVDGRAYAGENGGLHRSGPADPAVGGSQGETAGEVTTGGSGALKDQAPHQAEEVQHL